MRKKNGFVFVETIVVLTVTMISLLTLYNGYVLTLKSVQNKQLYDNVNDVYKTNVVKSMLINNSCINLSSTELYRVYAKSGNDKITNYYTCNDDDLSKKITDEEKCNEILFSSQTNEDETLGLSYIIFMNITEDNTNRSVDNIISSGKTNHSEIFKISFRRYLKTLDKGNNYLIVITKKDHKNYYASIKCG